MNKEYAEWLLAKLQEEWYQKYGKYMKYNFSTGEEWLELPEELELEEAELSEEIERLEIEIEVEEWENNSELREVMAEVMT